MGEIPSFAVDVAVSPVPIAASTVVMAVLLLVFGVSLIGDAIAILF